ncbi:Arm DNA-binding domain-containing protein [Desulfovibrio sp. ZJ369]|uniref:Arm DNA-binding domain-containing protein n=1 Tax=Desulfovibrio sp. ZJ369 TaxID=2709793 RepID=UPI0013ECB13E|nr:Arm DNA-binding domain-containing protein [Desulfovibrio sp. ZJ369]
MSLTDTAIRAVKPLEKPQKLFDGNGLFPLRLCTGMARQPDFCLDSKLRQGRDGAH